MTIKLEDQKSKKEHMVDFIKSVQTIEDCIRPYKEQLKDLRADFLEKEWLSKEELKYAMKAYRLLKDETDMEELSAVYDSLQSSSEN